MTLNRGFVWISVKGCLLWFLYNGCDVTITNFIEIYSTEIFCCIWSWYYIFIGSQITSLNIVCKCGMPWFGFVILTFQWLYHDTSSCRRDWRISEALRGFLWTERMTLSLVYSTTMAYGEIGWCYKYLRTKQMQWYFIDHDIQCINYH